MLNTAGSTGARCSPWIERGCAALGRRSDDSGAHPPSTPTSIPDLSACAFPLRRCRSVPGHCWSGWPAGCRSCSRGLANLPGEMTEGAGFFTVAGGADQQIPVLGRPALPNRRAADPSTPTNPVSGRCWSAPHRDALGYVRIERGPVDPRRLAAHRRSGDASNAEGYLFIDGRSRTASDRGAARRGGALLSMVIRGSGISGGTRGGRRTRTSRGGRCCPIRPGSMGRPEEPPSSPA